MYKVIRDRDTGKTKELLKKCSETGGVFVCKHPEKIWDKCKAYDIDYTKITPIGYNAIWDIVDDQLVYIDELESFISTYLNINLGGYSMTLEGYKPEITKLDKDAAYLIKVDTENNDVLKDIHTALKNLGINSVVINSHWVETKPLQE